MSLKRDLAWKYLETLYHSSVAYQYARYGLSINYETLPEKVVHQAKRCLLDAVGCAIGAYFAPARPMYEAMVKKLGGPEEATVIGSGLRTSAANATLVNSLLVRFLDYNDFGGGGHNSDAIPAIMAIAERQKTNGKDFITALVTSYELGARFIAAIRRREGSGFSAGVVGSFMHEVRGILTVPATLGPLMDLNEDQIANACGICGSHCLPLGVLDADREENLMSKSMRMGFVNYGAILALLLAEEGFTGPVRIIEGQDGINDAIYKGALDIESMVDFTGWRIMDVIFKVYPVSLGLAGVVDATIALVKENNVKAEDVLEVEVRVDAHNIGHHSTAAKKYARNAESADHSIYYSVAMAIKEGRLDPDLFEDKYLTDPVIVDLVDKIDAVAAPEVRPGGDPGKINIVTKDGRRLEKTLAQRMRPRMEPQSDKQLKDKFAGMAARYMSKQQIKKIFETIWNLEKVSDFNQLTKLLVFPRK